jgi:arginase family enzyme
MMLMQGLRGFPLVGLDLVEVSPPLDSSDATIFAALRLILEFIASAASSRKPA